MKTRALLIGLIAPVTDLVATRINLYPTETVAVPALANPETPADYPMVLSGNATLAQSVLKYLCVSARLTNVRAMEQLNAQACDAGVMLASAEGRVVCDTKEWRHTFSDILGTRQQALWNLNNRLRRDACRTLLRKTSTLFEKSTARTNLETVKRLKSNLLI